MGRERDTHMMDITTPSRITSTAVPLLLGPTRSVRFGGGGAESSNDSTFTVASKPFTFTESSIFDFVFNFTSVTALELCSWRFYDYLEEWAWLKLISDMRRMLKVSLRSRAIISLTFFAYSVTGEDSCNEWC